MEREARLGMLSAGKSYYDLMQALRDSASATMLRRHSGSASPRFGMTFPLDPQFVREFASGLETILVVEEKRSFLELQLREILYNLPSRPAILGKTTNGALSRADRRARSGQRSLPHSATFCTKLLERVAGRARIAEISASKAASELVGLDTSAPAARTIAPRCCSKARSPAAASAATPWRCA